MFDYFTLLNPLPIYVSGLGTLRKTRLMEIAEITLDVYRAYIFLLLLDIPTLYKTIDNVLYEKYMSLDDEVKSRIVLFDEIVKRPNLQIDYEKMLNFFIEENVVYDANTQSFIIYKTDNEDLIQIGAINKDTFTYVCKCILEIHKVTTKKPKERKFKNKLAERVWKMTHKDEEKASDPKMDLGNLISSMSSFSKGYNLLNIWSMTVYQFYDQFEKENRNVYFNVASRSVTIWGDKENKHDFTQWYENIFASSDSE